MKKEEKSWIRAFCAILLLVLCLGNVSNITSEAISSADAESMEVLVGKTAGVMTGTPQDKIVQENVKDVRLQYFNTATDMALALQTKKIDFCALSTVNYYNMVKQYPEFGYINVPLATFNVGTIFPKTKKGDAIRVELNEYISKIKENGELKSLQEYWLYPHDWENIEIPKTGEKGILKMATPNTLIPFSFMLHDKNVGFDIAIIAGFCKEYGYGLNIENVDFSGALTGISTEKYDLAAGQIAWTEERAESVNYSDFYYLQEIVAIVNADNIDSPYLVAAGKDDSTGNTDGGVSQSNQNRKRTIGESIRRTLIDENRWVSILQGLFVTMVITLAGFALANLFGALFCAMAMSKSKVLKMLAGIYSSLMQGLPIVVILMILYYVIFAYSKINNIEVAIFGFGLVFGAYMAQLFESSISGVDKGQQEAALAIGFTKRQTFNGIILPQAIRTMLPGYFSNLISLMKGTAIVGYIAITDLTKAGDIIRSNTYEAIVPLVTIAIVYFAIAALLFIVMNLIRKKLTPKYLQKIAAANKYKGDEKA